MRVEKFADISLVRDEALAEIQRQAEAIALLFISKGDRQAMAYLQKVKEAEAFSADPAIAPAEIPHVVAEAQLYGRTLLDQVAVVLTIYHQWKQIDPLIERKRLAARDAVIAAMTPAAAKAAAAIDWSDIEALAP